MSTFGMPRYKTVTPELVDKICEFLKEGMDRKNAYICAGIAPQTGNNWMSRGRAGNDPDPAYEEFFYKTQQARGEYVRSLYSKLNVITSSKDEWLPIMRLLESYAGEEHIRGSNHIHVDIDTSLSFVDQAKAISALVYRGELCVEDANKLNNMLATQVKIEENAELKAKVEQLEKIVEEYRRSITQNED